MRSTTFVITVASLLALGCGNNSYPVATTSGGVPNSGGAGGGAGGGGNGEDAGVRDAGQEVVPDGGFGPGAFDGGTLVDGGIAASPGMLLIESNENTANAIVMFRRAADGALSMIPGGKVMTGGAGIAADSSQNRGPFASDRNLIITPDQRYVLAVNTGSDSIAVLHFTPDGLLAPVPGSPFYSGGRNPVSLAVSGDHVFVVNKAIDGTTQPNYAVLTMAADGRLTADASKEQRMAVGASPTIAYLAPLGRQLFGTRFYDQARQSQERPEQLDAYAVDSEGTLAHADGSPYAAPRRGLAPPGAPPTLALNLVTNPNQNLLYVGLVSENRLGVYTYDALGDLTPLGETMPSSAKWPAFFRVDQAGRFLYSSNMLSGSVSTWDLKNPRMPMEKSVLALLNSMGAPFTDSDGVQQKFSSEPFQLQLDESGQHLYVLSQRVTNINSDLKGNYLHALDVGSAGLLDERLAPIDLTAMGIDPHSRPQGVLLVTAVVPK